MALWNNKHKLKCNFLAAMRIMKSKASEWNTKSNGRIRKTHTNFNRKQRVLPEKYDQKNKRNRRRRMKRKKWIRFCETWTHQEANQQKKKLPKKSFCWTHILSSSALWRWWNFISFAFCKIEWKKAANVAHKRNMRAMIQLTVNNIWRCRRFMFYFSFAFGFVHFIFIRHFYALCVQSFQMRSLLNQMNSFWLFVCYFGRHCANAIAETFFSLVFRWRLCQFYDFFCRIRLTLSEFTFWSLRFLHIFPASNAIPMLNFVSLRVVVVVYICCRCTHSFRSLVH